MQNTIKKIILLSLFTFLSACNGFFEKDNTPPASPLTEFHPEIKTKLLWRERAGTGTNEYLKTSLTTNHRALFTTSKKGQITALDLCSGKILWQVGIKQAITTGAGVGDHLVVVGTDHGHVIALRQDNGCILWQREVKGELLATPVVANDKIVVKTTNGNVYALASSNGSTLWVYQQTEPTLILRGSSTPLIANNHVIAGFANGKLAKLNLSSGDQNWLTTIAIPQGAFGIQRMVDINADPLMHNHQLYAATYQGKIAALNWLSGVIQWSNDISTYTGMAADDETVYVSDAKSHIWAFTRQAGQLKWHDTQLQYRGISGPILLGNYVVVGDQEGYLHWLNKFDGHLAGRTTNRGGAIYTAPLVENDVLYVLSSQGYVSAYTLVRI